MIWIKMLITQTIAHDIMILYCAFFYYRQEFCATNHQIKLNTTNNKNVNQMNNFSVFFFLILRFDGCPNTILAMIFSLKASVFVLWKEGTIDDENVEIMNRAKKKKKKNKRHERYIIDERCMWQYKQRSRPTMSGEIQCTWYFSCLFHLLYTLLGCFIFFYFCRHSS